MSNSSTVHLICNAHLDPVWLWDWQEGAAEAISTFRTAADLCEEFDGFVFNHNEVILYQWIEEYDPALFERIRRLVADNRWHIMGGWYLQPDCTMPHGESFVRQIEAGRRYFTDRFGQRPETAINFDPFGHSRGIVQILAKAGFSSYLFCRPGKDRIALPGNDFLWVGCDGSTVIARRSPEHYNSPLGGARGKVESAIAEKPEDHGLILWGIGDHGGGPSRKDVADLAALIGERSDLSIVHSTPEAYFTERYGSAIAREALPRFAGSIIPWAVGCYTSQVRIKQEHARLEADLFRTEKMLVQAVMSSVGSTSSTELAFPYRELDDAQQDLLTAQFHDILPGSSIESVENWALRMLGHGREILERLRARAFFALCREYPPAEEGEVSVFAYNPHPVAMTGAWECEFNLADQNWGEDHTVADVYYAGGDTLVPSQIERESSNLNLDWRKHIVFHATLPAASVARFDCRLRRVTDPAEGRENGTSAQADPTDDIVVTTADHEVRVSRTTGLISSYTVNGVSVFRDQIAQLVAISDTADPWGMQSDRFDGSSTPLSLASPQAAGILSGTPNASVPPVQIVESGPVRTVVEAVFEYQRSAAVVQYRIPHNATGIELDIRLYWQEKDTLVKLLVPVELSDPEFIGQCPYGIDQLFSDGRETSSGRWCALRGADYSLLVTKPGIYGADYRDRTLRLSLLRSPGYSAHPIQNRPFMEDPRFTPRIDQGFRRFSLALEPVATEKLEESAARSALRYAEPPECLAFNPTGTADPQRLPFIELSDPAVDLAACRLSRDGKELILRLHCTSTTGRNCQIRIASLKVKFELSLGPAEIRTLGVDRQTGEVRERPLIEEVG